MRPDLSNWLYPLSRASVLVCDCLSRLCKHARVLVSLLRGFSQTVRGMCAESEVLESDEPRWEPEETDVDRIVPFTQKGVVSQSLESDETLRGIRISQNVGSPTSWNRIVREIRGAPMRIFWEIFAG